MTKSRILCLLAAGTLFLSACEQNVAVDEPPAGEVLHTFGSPPPASESGPATLSGDL